MSRNNTGNPIGSKAFPDFEDNVKNLDEAVNSTAMTFRDRMGRLRATVAGGTDPSGVAQVAADAADRAETARDAAFVNADVYPTVAEGRAAVANGEQFQVVEGDAIVRYRRDSPSAQTEVARYPSKRWVDERTDFTVEYIGGNLIGPKTPRYTNFGLNSVWEIRNTQWNDSIVIPVKSGDVLFIFNDKANYSPSGGTQAFFKEDPARNPQQTRITEFSMTSVTDPVTQLGGRRYIVPDEASYLMLNSRYTRADGTVNDTYTWAVHKDDLSADLEPGVERVTRINGTDIGDPTVYAPLLQSQKNLFDYRETQPRVQVTQQYIQLSNTENDVASPAIPVEFGKHYTISGLDHDLLASTVILGFSVEKPALSPSGPGFVKLLAPTSSLSPVTIYIDDASIKSIVFAISDRYQGDYTRVPDLLIQVEEGQEATEYEPFVYEESALKLFSTLATRVPESGISPSQTSGLFSDFMELNKTRDAETVLTPITMDLGPLGVNYTLQADSGIGSNNLFAKRMVGVAGKKEIYAHVAKFVGADSVAGSFDVTPFTVPSGALDNDDSIPEAIAGQVEKFDYVHPDIAYDPEGVAGFKYWMISSYFPSIMGTRLALWEDEDMFVSNDAKNWQRIRSLYETDKEYTTETLRLPPQTLVTTTARRHAFLPIPSRGDTIEISVPEDNGAPALDRVNITLTGNPWKHDPSILIDGGYVYTYHTYHLSYPDRPGADNRFRVCVRTSNGIDWEVVRPDGSTMLLTEASSRQLFTKDEQGRYNYMLYSYKSSYANPRVIKWGPGDYLMFAGGGNFDRRIEGTTPYTFDFQNQTNVPGMGNLNHPEIIKYGSNLYIINNRAVHVSTDKGVSFTPLPHYPMWLGGVMGVNYKKTSCIGEDGKYFVIDVQRLRIPAAILPPPNGVAAALQFNQAHIYEFPSFDDFLSRAEAGLPDAYVDVLVCRVNHADKTRNYFVAPGVSLKNPVFPNNGTVQRVKVGEMDFKAGDELFMYVTLVSRNGAKIVFGGIDIA